MQMSFTTLHAKMSTYPTAPLGPPGMHGHIYTDTAHSSAAALLLLLGRELLLGGLLLRRLLAACDCVRHFTNASFDSVAQGSCGVTHSAAHASHSSVCSIAHSTAHAAHSVAHVSPC